MTAWENISWLRKINAFLLVASIFFLPYWIFIVPRILTFYVASSLVLAIYERKKLNLKLPFLLLLGLYGLYVLGMNWTDNIERAYFDFEVKMSLAIFPVNFILVHYSRKEIKVFLMTFLAALVVCVPVCFYRAYHLPIAMEGINVFFYDTLTRPIHPGYLSMYFNLGLLLVIMDYKYKTFNFFKDNLYYYLLFLFYFGFNILIFSKTGIIISTVILVLFVVFYIQKTKKMLIPVVGIMASITLFLAAYNYSDYARNTTNELMTNAFSTNQEMKAQGSVSLRQVVWTASLKLIKEKPLIGYGTGGAQQALVNEYSQMEEPFAEVKKLNAHNQFLQTALSLGLTGGLLLMSIFLLPFYQLTKSKNYLAIAFMCMITINFMTESTLETQAGTIFFGLFYCILQLNLTNE